MFSPQKTGLEEAGQPVGSMDLPPERCREAQVDQAEETIKYWKGRD